MKKQESRRQDTRQFGKHSLAILAKPSRLRVKKEAGAARVAKFYAKSAKKNGNDCMLQEHKGFFIASQFQNNTPGSTISQRIPPGFCEKLKQQLFRNQDGRTQENTVNTAWLNFAKSWRLSREKRGRNREEIIR